MGKNIVIFVAIINGLALARKLPGPEMAAKNRLRFQRAKVIDGHVMFEGDITYRNDRKATAANSTRWPKDANGIPRIPYCFVDAEVNQVGVKAAIAHWEEHTCIRFDEVPVNNSLTNVVRFISGGGCYSDAGMQTFPQNVSIPPGCEQLGIASHEIGHAVGFYHEQSRSDRDSYVKILTHNIDADMIENYDKANDNNYSVPYDYSSNLHYGRDAFLNASNGNAMVTLDPLDQELIGLIAGLSYRDILLANRMYNCLGLWIEQCSINSSPCLNDGYIGSNCSCVCPPGTTGSNCEDVVSDYYSALRSPCSEEITTEGTIMTPGYPMYTSEFVDFRCTKVIKSPPCKVVQITFSGFQLHPRVGSGGILLCYFDVLELRLSDPHEGQFFCGMEIAPGESFISSADTLILYYEHSNLRKGFKANVAFINDANNATCVAPTTAIPATPAAPELTQPCNAIKKGSTTSFVSKNYGIKNYPENYMCYAELSSETPKYAVVTFIALSLHPTDYVEFVFPYETSVKRFSDQKQILTHPSYNSFKMSFVSDDSGTGAGFKINVQKVSSKCHRSINLLINKIKKIKTPTFPMKHDAPNVCEWVVKAPCGYKVQFEFSKIQLPGNCEKAYVVIDKSYKGRYLKADSEQFCGTQKKTVVSNGQRMNIVHFSNGKTSYGFEGRIKLIK